MTAWSIRKTGAPSSDRPRSLSPRPAARIAIGVGDGVAERFDDAPKLDGTDTVPAPGLKVRLGDGLGDGVAVETSTGGDVGVSLGLGVDIGVDMGVSVGVGDCANNKAVTRNAPSPKTTARRLPNADRSCESGMRKG